MKSAWRIVTPKRPERSQVNIEWEGGREIRELETYIYSNRV